MTASELLSFSAVAAVFAGCFHAWRVLAGHYVVGLSMKVDAKRLRAAVADKHDLIITVRLKKPPGSTLSLQSLRVTVKEEESILSDTEISEARPTDVGRAMNLAPHDELQFSTHAQIPMNTTAKIVVVLKAQRYWLPVLVPVAKWSDKIASRDAFWTASVISVPGAVVGTRQSRGKNAALAPGAKAV